MLRVVFASVELLLWSVALEQGIPYFESFRVYTGVHNALVPSVVGDHRPYRVSFLTNIRAPAE
jgi:hypothetical protein